MPLRLMLGWAMEGGRGSSILAEDYACSAVSQVPYDEQGMPAHLRPPPKNRITVGRTGVCHHLNVVQANATTLWERQVHKCFL